MTPVTSSNDLFAQIGLGHGGGSTNLAARARARRSGFRSFLFVTKPLLIHLALWTSRIRRPNVAPEFSDLFALFIVHSHRSW
jgi:hypothetical protein